ncbi:MAG: nuclear transport factor 2 family protein [Terriglobia bacterium]
MSLAVAAAATVLLGQAPGKKSSASQGSNLFSLLVEREKAGWEAFKNKDRKAFSAIAADDYTAVLADGKGEQNLQSTLNSMNAISINRYTLSDFKLTPLGPNAALLRYNASANYGIAGGQAVDGKLAVGDLWVKRGGQWKSLRYQETEVK